MARTERRAGPAGKSLPISVAVSREQRAEFQKKARRRGLGLSTAIRTLAVERANELSYARQRERAWRWQTERIRALADRIENGEIGEASQREIDEILGG